MMKLSKQARGGILLIGSTAIGVGMLALPVSTAPLGFGYSFLALVAVWYFTVISAFMLLETNLFLGKGRNLGFLAKETLGKPGLIITTSAYLALLYALIVAHLTAGSAWVVNKAQLHGWAIDFTEASIGFAIFIYVVVCAGTWFADLINRILMVALMLSFGLLCFLLAQHANLPTLLDKPQDMHWSILPVITLAFGFHIIIPTLTAYIDDPKQMRISLGLGCVLPLIVYVCWQLLTLGTLPFEGMYGLDNIRMASQPTSAIIAALAHTTKSHYLGQILSAFIIIVLTTSFIGVGISLFDFLADALSSLKLHLGARLRIGAIAILPPTFFVLTKPDLFLEVLNFGGLCVALLLGILPAAMFWKIQRQGAAPMCHRYFGKTWHIVLNLLFFSTIILIECHNLWGK